MIPFYSHSDATVTSSPAGGIPPLLPRSPGPPSATPDVTSGLSSTPAPETPRQQQQQQQPQQQQPQQRTLSPLVTYDSSPPRLRRDSLARSSATKRSSSPEREPAKSAYAAAPNSANGFHDATAEPNGAGTATSSSEESMSSPEVVASPVNPQSTTSPPAPLADVDDEGEEQMVPMDQSPRSPRRGSNASGAATGGADSPTTSQPPIRVNSVDRHRQPPLKRALMDRLSDRFKGKQHDKPPKK